MKDLDITPIGLTKLDNSLHLQFHNKTYNQVKAVEAAKTGVPEAAMTPWLEGINTEKQTFLEPTADADTRRLLQADAERDHLLYYFFGTVRSARFSPEAAEAEAALDLYPIVRRHAGLAGKAFERETADIGILLEDLRKPHVATRLATLHMAAFPAKLEAANKAYEELSTRRGNTQAELRPTGQVVQMRRKTDDAYKRVIKILEYNYLLGQTPIDKDEIAALAQRLNQVADDINEVWHHSQSQRKRKPSDGKKPKDPKTPKEPKDPKQPKDPKPTPDPKPQPDPKPTPDPKPNPKPGDDDGDDVYIPKD